jgi:hypothetical protein
MTVNGPPGETSSPVWESELALANRFVQRKPRFLDGNRFPRTGFRRRAGVFWTQRLSLTWDFADAANLLSLRAGS